MGSKRRGEEGKQCLEGGNGLGYWGKLGLSWWLTRCSQAVSHNDEGHERWAGQRASLDRSIRGHRLACTNSGRNLKRAQGAVRFGTEEDGDGDNATLGRRKRTGLRGVRELELGAEFKGTS